MTGVIEIAGYIFMMCFALLVGVAALVIMWTSAFEIFESIASSFRAAVAYFRQRSTADLERSRQLVWLTDDEAAERGHRPLF